MADINKFTTKEVLNKVLLDSSGDAVAAFSHTSQEALNAVLDTANNRLNISLVGGAISGDLTVGGDLIVSGGGSQAFDEIITGSSSIKSTTEGSATAGAQFRLFTDDGSTMESGDRLGFIEFAGAEDASNNIIVGASIQAFTEAQWSATENGTSLKFFTTDANNSHSEVLALDSNKNATFSGNIIQTGKFVTDTNSRIFPSTGTSTTSTVFGKLAGVALESGAVENILIGEGSGKSITTGDGNVVIGGKDVLDDVTTGSDNIAIGRFVLQKTDTDISGIIAIGKQAMGFALGGNGTVTSAANGAVVVGNEAGLEMTTSAGTVFIGNKAGFEHRAGNNNTIVGSDAFDNTNAVANASNTGLGQSVFGGAHAGTSTGNVAIGVASMNGALNGADFNTCMGVSSGASITTGDQNIAIGYQTMSNAALTGSNNISMGYRALFAATGCSNLISIGTESGSGALTNAADGSIFIGYQSANAMTIGQFNTAVGFETLLTETDSDNNTAVGYQALRNSNVTDNAGANTAIGSIAMGAGALTGKENVAIGSSAMKNLGSGFSNIGIGVNAGFSGVTGTHNVMVGDRAGQGNRPGSRNVLLGPGARLDEHDDSFQVKIGDNGIIKYKAARMTITKAHSGDNTVIAEVCKIPALSIIHKVTATVITKSNLSTYILNLSLSTTGGSSEDAALANASTTITVPEILGAGGVATYAQNSATVLGTAADIVASSGTANNTVYTAQPTTTIVGTADTFLYICNAGTGNGTTDSSAVVLDICVEYFGNI